LCIWGGSDAPGVKQPHQVRMLENPSSVWRDDRLGGLQEEAWAELVYWHSDQAGLSRFRRRSTPQAGLAFLTVNSALDNPGAWPSTQSAQAQQEENRFPGFPAKLSGRSQEPYPPDLHQLYHGAGNLLTLSWS
jgi:hypothetical protein